MAHLNSRNLQPGVREDPRLVRESMESSRASMVRTSTAFQSQRSSSSGVSAGYGGATYVGAPGAAGHGGGAGYGGRTSQVGGMGYSGAGSGEWVLEPINWEGRTYLLDRRTGAVYADTPDDQYPEMVGRWQDNRVVFRSRNVVVDLFANLDQYLKNERVKFGDLFRRFDTDGSGTLEFEELGQLVAQLVPGVTAAELKYIMAMLDSSGDGRVDQQEFLAAAKASLAAAKRLQAERAAGGTGGANSDVQTVLRRVTDYLRANRETAAAAFARFDTNGNGRLEPRELARFFAEAVPGLGEDQLRYLLSHMYELDANGDGTVSFPELLQALRAAEVTRGQAPVLAPQPSRLSSTSSRRMSVSYGGAGSGEWVLEPINWEGRTYLLDRRTGAVYADTPEDQYPEMVGRWQDNRVVLRSRNVVVDLFANLDQYLKNERVKFGDLFRRFDTDGSGTLEFEELGQLVAQLVPGVTAAELKYIMAMLDSSGDGRVDQQEFLAAAKASLAAAKKLQAERAAGGTGGANSDVQTVLRRVTDYLRANRETAAAAFARFDTNGNGRLEPRELARFFAEAVPGLGEDQLRYLLSHMYELDANGDGTVSFPELLQALRAAEVTRGQATAATRQSQQSYGRPPLARQASIAAMPGGAEWVLEDVYDPNTGRQLKRDPATGLVYSEVIPGEWPQVVGVQDASGVLRMTQRRDDGGLFAALDAYLRTNKVKFRDMFDHFDADRSGQLDMGELRQLVATILPGFTEGQLHYFQALLDINGDGGISFEEMMGVAKECLKAEKAAAASGGARDPSVKAALDRFQAYLLQYSSIAYQHFEAADTSRRGYLSFPEFARFLQNLMPDLQEAQRRAILSYLYAQDVDQSGVISWLMLARFMRVPQLAQLAPPGAVGASPLVTSPSRGSYGQVAPAAPAGSGAGSRSSLQRMGTSPHRVTFEGDSWQLEEVMWRGEPYLLDQHTKRVYRQDQSGDWPRLVGVYRDGTVVIQERAMASSLFETLDAYLKQHKMRCREVFSHFDSGGKGWLAPDELGRLVEHFLPGGQVTPGDVKYFQVMVDRNQDGQVTYEEFLEAARSCRSEEAAARDRNPDVARALQLVSDYARNYGADMRNAFTRFDVNRNGLLEPREVARLLRTAVQPPLDDQQLRYALAHLHAYDMDGDGCLSYREFCIAMRAVDARARVAGGREDVVLRGGFTTPLGGSSFRGDSAMRSSMAGTTRSRSRTSMSSVDGADPDAEWVLQEFPYNGQMLLLDPRTQRVYHSPDGRSWPQLLGKLENGRVTRAAELRPNDLWTRLDTYLKANQLKLKELFDMYDADHSGTLRPAELGRLIKDMLPGVTRAELHYFLAMMDANGDGAVSYDELLSAARDSLRATQQLSGAGASGISFPPDALSVLDTLSQRLAENSAQARRTFTGCDRDGDGALNLSEASRFLRTIMPELGARQLQYVLSYLGTLDLDGDGQLRFSELMAGLHALQPRGPNGARYSRSFTSAPGSSGGSIRTLASFASLGNRAAQERANAEMMGRANPAAYTRDWELHEWRYRGALYLLDRTTGLVYGNVTSAQEWPPLVGRKVGEALQPLDSSATMTFFKNLDVHLKSEQLKFATLFAEFDRGRKGYLDRTELAALVRRVMPEATDAQIHFLAVVLDENNDHVFTQDELLGAARKVLQVLRQQQAAGAAGGSAGGPSPEVAAVLDRFSRLLRDNMDRARSIFESLDPQRSGYLDYDGVAMFFRRLVGSGTSRGGAPRLTGEDLRHLLAQVHLYDVDGVGQVTFAELLRALHAADLRSTRGTHATGWATAGGRRSLTAAQDSMYDAPTSWRLEPYRWGDRDVLLDPSTQVVYSRPRGDGDWPVPVGRLTQGPGGRTSVTAIRPDSFSFFKRLDAFLKDGKIRLRQLFDAADADRSGALDSREMGRLVKHVMPEATSPQLNYLLAMLDVHGLDQVTYEQFLQVCRDSLAAETSAAATGPSAAELPPEAAAALRRLSETLVHDRDAALSLFRQADRDGSGRLEPREVAALLRRLAPHLQPEELRVAVVALFRNMDHNGDGTLSFQEFMYAMRAVELQTPDRIIAAGSWRSGRGGGYAETISPVQSYVERPAVREPVLASLELEETRLGGQRYLLSRYNNFVYEIPGAQAVRAQQWPRVVGLFDPSSGGLQRTTGQATSAELFSALDRYLKSAQVRFSDVFARYDTDRSGRLEPRELGNLVADLLGPQAASPADVAYFVAMLDLDGSRSVTEQEFLAVAKEYLALERRATDWSGAQSEDVRKALERLSKYLQADKEGNCDVFRRHDVKQEGRLTLLKLPAFFTDVLRGQRLAQREMHYLLTHAHGSDLAKTGRFSFNDLLIAFRAIFVRYPGGTAKPGFPAGVAPGAGTGPRPGQGAAPPSVARLEAFQHQGAAYYRDPDTGLVYVLVDDRRLGPRLELAPFRTSPGRTGSRTVIPGPGSGRDRGGRGGPNPADRLFEALDTALKENRVRLRDVFDRYDTNRNGVLEGRELGRLVRDLLGPSVSEADIGYLLAMMDVDGDSAVSYEELVAAVRDCWAAVKDRAADGGAGPDGPLLESLLERIGAYLRSQRESAAATFARFDVNGNGRLEPRELARFLRACLPELSSMDIRHLMTHLHSLDLNGDGALSYVELAHAMYGMDLQLPDGRRLSAKYVARPVTDRSGGRAAPSARSDLGNGRLRPFAEVREWRLDAWHCRPEGRDYLLDPQTGLVFQLAAKAAAARVNGGGAGREAEDGTWPVLIGARTPDGHVRRLESTLGHRFFEALDRKLRIERVHLTDLMASFDRDASASLDARELRQLARVLLGEELSTASTKYLMALLDLDGDRLVTREEVLDVFQQMGDAGRRIGKLQDPDVVAVLNKLSSALSLNQRAAWERFCRADGNGSGKLEPRELRWFMDAILPGCAPRDMQQLMVYMQLLDVNDSGGVEWKELLTALRVLPARTPDGLLRPPRPPFRIRRAVDDYDRGRDRSRHPAGGSYDDDVDGYGSEGGRRNGRAAAYPSDGSANDYDDDVKRGRAVDPAADITDREFVMELRPLPQARSSDRRRRADRAAAGADAPSGTLLRDSESGLLYNPPDGGVKGGWPQLAAYTDPRDSVRRALPSLATWRMLLDLDELVRAEPDMITEAVEAAARRRSGAGGYPTRGSGTSRRDSSGNDALDTRTAGSVLLRLALKASGGGSIDGRRSSSGSSGGGADAWVAPLLRGMVEVMHDSTVRVRKLPRDVEALAAAYRLLTDAREGPALLREVATALNREYRKVVRAMRKKVFRTGGDEHGRDDAGAGGSAVLRLRDVRDVLCDTLPEVLSNQESAMAALLYLLYHCPHCLTRGSQNLTLGWKDVFKALRAIKCRYPDGTARVAVWDAEELARESSEATSPSSSSSGSSRSSSPSQASASRPHPRRDRRSSLKGGGDDRPHRRPHRRDEYRHGRDKYDRSSYGRGPSYIDDRAHGYRRDGRVYGQEVYDPSIYGQGYNPAAQMHGKGARYGGGAPYDVAPEVVAAQVAAMGVDPMKAAELQRLAAVQRSYNYIQAAPTPVMVDSSASAAVQQRMDTDLRMSHVRSVRQLNVAELAKRKVHPARRTVVLEPYTSPDGHKLSLDPATGLVYFLSQSPDYPELAGKLRPSGEFHPGGGSTASLQMVFNKLRPLDDTVLAQLFKAYDTNKNGTLELKELMVLLRDVTGLPYAEAGLVQALLDVDLSSTLTLKEWLVGIRASTDSLDAASAYARGLNASGGSAGGGGGGDVSRVQRNALTVLAAVSKQISGDLEVFWAAYARADGDANGYLDISELTRFFKDLFRGMPAYDLRLLVAYCFTADLEKDGLVRPDELLQHLRAIQLEGPNGVVHRPGFRVPSAAPARAGLMDSIRSVDPNARFNYVKNLTIEVPDGGPESLASALPPGSAFPSQQQQQQQQQQYHQGPATVYPMTPGGIPPTPLTAVSAGGGLPGMPPYMPVPVPVPYMMPQAPGISMTPGGASPVMGYLLPYQQDVFQALIDRLATPRTSVSGSRSGRRRTSASGRSRVSESGTVYSAIGSDGTPISSDMEDEPSAPPPPPVVPPPPAVRGLQHGVDPQPSRQYVEAPPPPHPDDVPLVPQPSYSEPYSRRSSFYGSRTPSYGSSDQHGYGYDNPAAPYDVRYRQPPGPPSPAAAAAAVGNGFGAVMELQHIVSADPTALHTRFSAAARRVPASSVPAARRPYGRQPASYTYVIPRAALGQLIHQLHPALHETERTYTVAVLTALLPYNRTSYSEEDLLFAVREGAAIERSVQERRLPADVAAVAARLADDVMGNAAYSAAKAAFMDADRYRRGTLLLPEAARVLTRLGTVPPTAVAWLTAGLAHYAANVLQGASNMSYKELGAALSYMSSNTSGPPLSPYTNMGGGHMADPAYPHPYTSYGGQQPPYNDGRFPAVTGVPPGVTQPQQYSSAHPMPSPFDSRYPLSPQNSYNASQPAYGAPHHPYGAAPGLYGATAPAPYNAPPSPHGVSPPSPHAIPPTPYGPAPVGPYGAPTSPYGNPPHSPHGPIGHGLQAPTPAGMYGGGPYDNLSAGGAYGAPGYPSDPRQLDPSTSAGLPVGSAYYMWTHDNRQAVVQKHISEVLKGRVSELEAQKGALEKEAGLQTKILSLQNTLLANETAQRDVLALIQTYAGAGVPPVSVQEMVARIRATLEEAIQLARTSATAGAVLPPGSAVPADFDSLLDALTNARWVGGQPVSTDTLRTALALRRDAFALQRAHTAAMMDLDARRTGMEVAAQEARQAMSIQLKLLQDSMQRQAQELQQRLLLEAQAIAAASGAAAQAPPGLLLPPAHAGTATLVAGLGAAAAAAGASGSAPLAAVVANSPPLVMSPRTWQLEPATSWSGTSAAASAVPYMFPSGSRAPSAGGGLPPAVFPAPPRD